MPAGAVPGPATSVRAIAIAAPVTAVPTPRRRKAEPRTAPVATDAADGSPLISATTGTTVSGSDVPRAASRLPVAPLASLSR